MNFKKIGNFYLIKIKNEFYLISANFESSIKRDKEIQKFLKSIEFNGKLYIDTILTTGTSENRFLIANFKDRVIGLTIANSTVARRINKISQVFFSKNIDLLKKSHLTERQIIETFEHIKNLCNSIKNTTSLLVSDNIY